MLAASPQLSLALQQVSSWPSTSYFVFRSPVLSLDCSSWCSSRVRPVPLAALSVFTCAYLTRLPRAATVRSWDIFKTVSLLSGIVSILIVLSALWILIEVGQARRNVKALREENARADDDFNSSDKYFNSSDNSCDEGPDQLKNSKAFKDFKNLVSRAKKEDQEPAQKNKKSRGLSRRSGSISSPRGNNLNLATVAPTETPVTIFSSS